MGTITNPGPKLVQGAGTTSNKKLTEQSLDELKKILAELKKANIDLDKLPNIDESALAIIDELGEILEAIENFSGSSQEYGIGDVPENITPAVDGVYLLDNANQRITDDAGNIVAMSLAVPEIRLPGLKHLAILITSPTQTTTPILEAQEDKLIVALSGLFVSRDEIEIEIRDELGGFLIPFVPLPEGNFILPPTSIRLPHFMGRKIFINCTGDGVLSGYLNYCEIASPDVGLLD